MATDAFTGTDGTALPTYSANWSYVVGATTDHQIQSNAVATNSGGDVASRSNHQAYGNDQFSQAIISGVETGQFRGVCVRMGANGSNNYYGFAADGVSCLLFRYESGSFTQIGSTGTGGIANGQLIRLEIEGTTLRPFINGSQTGTPGNQTDATYASGVPGIYTSGAGLTFLIDTWEGNDLVAVDVDSVTPNTFADAEAGVVIAGSLFAASQGTGRVTISPTNNIDGEATIAPSLVASALGGTTTTTSFTITIPAVLDGDIGILEFCHRGTGDGSVTDNVGAGWTRKTEQLFNGSTFSGQLYWKRFEAADSGGTITVTALTDSCAGILTVYRDVIGTGDPFDGAATIVGEENASGNETQAEITTLVDNCMVCLTVLNSPDLAVATQACTTPGALTERSERLSTGGTDSSIAHASAVRTTAGATGAFTWTQTNAASGSYAYALQPRAPLGASVGQTETAWADTSITFTAVQGALPTASNLWLLVENDSDVVGSFFPVQFEAGAGGNPARFNAMARRRRGG